MCYDINILNKRLCVIIKAIDCSFYNASAIALRPSFYIETDVKAGVSLLKYQKHLSWTYLLW